MNRSFVKYFKEANWAFLAFLIGVTSIKLQIKLIFIAAYFGFLLYKKASFKDIVQSPVKFYLLMPLVGVTGALLHGAFDLPSYWFGSALGSLIWVMCAASFVLLYVTLNTAPREKNMRSVEIFFLINAVICCAEFIQMVVVSQHLFPYWYTELDYIYGVSTGDHLHGLFQDNSTINAAICLLGVFYFIAVKRYGFAMMNLAICLLCTSNLTVFILLASIGLAFIVFVKQRKVVFASGIVCIALYLFISPSNFGYVERVLNKINKQSQTEDPIYAAQVADKRIASDTTAAMKEVPAKLPEPDKVQAQLSKPFNIARQSCIVTTGAIPSDSILKDFSGPVLANLGTTSLYFDEHIPEDTNALRRVMQKWYGVPYDSLPLSFAPKPGKILYGKNTIAFLKSGIGPMLFGAGQGNFSSKLAIKMTGLKLQGTYPSRYAYINRSYFENTFYVHMFFWAKSIPDRSIINYPGSVYGQIAGEYGLVGIALFAIFYIFYFLKKSFRQKHKLVLLFAVLLLFFFDYWFELLNLTILFELFMLIDLQTDRFSVSQEKIGAKGEN